MLKRLCGRLGRGLIVLAACAMVAACGERQEAMVGPQSSEDQAALQQMEEMQRQQDEMAQQFIQQMPQFQGAQPAPAPQEGN